MKMFFLGKALSFVGRKMDGKKTYAGAIGKILTGLATLCGGIVGLLGHAFPDQELPSVEVEVAWGAVMGGLAVIGSGLQGVGIGHKLEKARREVAEGR